MTDERAELLDAILKFGSQLGVPVLVLFGVLYLAREAGVAMYSTAVVPLVEAHTKFLDSTQTTLKEIGAIQKQQADTMEEIVVGQKEIATIIKAREDRN